MNKHKNKIIFINKVVDVRATILCQNKCFFSQKLTQIGSMEELNNKIQHGPLMEVTNLHKADF